MKKHEKPVLPADIDEDVVTDHAAQPEQAIIENVVVLTASPSRVWSVITDFAVHSQWKPFTQLSGDAVKGGDVTCTLRIIGFSEPIPADANIVRFEKPVVLAWTAGIEKFLRFEEAYELEPDVTGTRLHHSLRFHGVFSNLWASLLRNRLQLALVRSDRCLERQLRKLSAPATNPPRHPTNGRGRDGLRKSR